MSKLPIVDKYYKPVYWERGIQPNYSIVFVIKKPEFLTQLEKNMLAPYTKKRYFEHREIIKKFVHGTKSKN